jgi:hypothetical protein
MFEALLLGMAFEVAAVQKPAFVLKVQAPPLARVRSAPGLVCSMLVRVADPDIDRDFVKTMERSVDPAFTKVSDCQATDVRRLQDPPGR